MRQCFRSNWDVKAFARRLVSMWVNCLEEILITHSYFSVMIALYVTLFLLIISSNFHICLFFVKSKDFLYQCQLIFSIRWNSSGFIDSKSLPLNCSMLFLSLSCMTWFMYIASSKNSSPACCWEADHNFSWDQKKVIGRESRLIPRKIKETITK